MKGEGLWLRGGAQESGNSKEERKLEKGSEDGEEGA